MGQVSSQLSLPIGLKDTESFASFIPGQNAQACSHLNALFSQLQNKKVNNWLTYLFSDSGLGKSHLLYATCQQAELAGDTCIYLSFDEKQHLSPDVLLGLEYYRLICLDDIEKLQSESAWQIAVFDLINRVKEQNNSCLVITGNQPPQLLSRSLRSIDLFLLVERFCLFFGMSLWFVLFCFSGFLMCSVAFFGFAYYFRYHTCSCCFYFDFLWFYISFICFS